VARAHGRARHAARHADEAAGGGPRARLAVARRRDLLFRSLSTLAAEAAGGAALDEACVARELALHYLSLARESPAATCARVLRRDATGALLRVESRDGAGRLATLASVGVGPPL
jgi:hypothetical protein